MWLVILQDSSSTLTPEVASFFAKPVSPAILTNSQTMFSTSGSQCSMQTFIPPVLDSTMPAPQMSSGVASSKAGTGGTQGLSATRAAAIMVTASAVSPHYETGGNTINWYNCHLLRQCCIELVHSCLMRIRVHLGESPPPRVLV